MDMAGGYEQTPYENWIQTGSKRYVNLETGAVLVIEDKYMDDRFTKNKYVFGLAGNPPQSNYRRLGKAEDIGEAKEKAAAWMESHPAPRRNTSENTAEYWRDEVY